MRKILTFLLMSVSTLATAEAIPLLFGTSTGNKSGSLGIYATDLETDTGKLHRPARLVAELNGPGFLVRHPELPVIYTVANVPGKRDGIVAAFSHPVGQSLTTLTPLGTVMTGQGKGTHLAVHPSGKLLVTVQYGDGSIVVLPVDPDGRPKAPGQTIQLTEVTEVNPQRQDGPHPHNITFSPCGSYALVPDLGADCTYIYKVDLENRRLVEHGRAASAPGAGPRHMKFSADGAFAYVLNELALTVDAFKWDAATGSLQNIGTYETLSSETKAAEQANTAAEIRLHPNGRFVYTSNRGNDSISVFARDGASGTLQRIQVMPARVAWPRNFALDASGRFLVCGGQDSSTAGSFLVDPESGLLTYVRQSSVVVPSPICVLFLD